MDLAIVAAILGFLGFFGGMYVRAYERCQAGNCRWDWRDGIYWAILVPVFVAGCAIGLHVWERVGAGVRAWGIERYGEGRWERFWGTVDTRTATILAVLALICTVLVVVGLLLIFGGMLGWWKGG